MAGSERIIADDETDPFDGDVRWHPAKSLWIGTMTLLAVVLGPLFFSWSALILSWRRAPSRFASDIPSACIGA
jgi:hypothetical protein